ncbi:MAG: 4-alpha-glucanotransferase [Clostridia bacterium]|nr:4-alpha-glucanotransferase [Clostridia bacterium]
MKQRKSGVLMHISSLPSGYGCGSFGKYARKFIDKMSECGFTVWQVLPLCVPDSYSSPYSSVSAFSGNPNFIDLETLFEKGYITHAELEAAREKTPYATEFSRLREERPALLKKAARRALSDKSTADLVDDFMTNHPYIADFCRFAAIKEANGETAWDEWKTENYSPDDEAVHRFIQYEFFSEWASLLKYAHSKGVYIVGDIPFYVARDSSDVWAHREQYLIGKDGKPEWVAGVPPDYFSEDGQLWGNPLYDWETMKKDNFSFWRDRMRHMFSMFDGVRIDHFRAVESYYAVPGTSKTAKNGVWRTGPREAFVDMIKETASEFEGEKLIIAEDLGDITDEVRALLDYSGFPGMRVLQFGYLYDGDSLHRPHNYSRNCVAYTGTHDNNTLLGGIWEMPPERRRDLFDYCGCGNDWNEACVGIIRELFASAADTVIIPIQDILGYGADTRMNKPGIADNNWSFRISKEQLESVNTARYRRFCSIFAR